MIVPGNVPTSVANERACAICWRNFGASTRYRQTLDGVSRSLCLGCSSRISPVSIGTMRDAQQVELALPDLTESRCEKCGHRVDVLPGETHPICAGCWIAASLEAL